MGKFITQLSETEVLQKSVKLLFTTLAFLIRRLVQILATVLLMHVPANIPVRVKNLVQVRGCLPPTWETRMQFPAWGFGQAQL